jgi:succinate dehydrogenase / fumarate reductase cytochrome b subunit
MPRHLIRLQSLLGLLPLGAYLLLHLHDHWPAASSRELWVDHSVRHWPRAWIAWVVLASLGAHAALGAMRLRREPSTTPDQRGLRSIQAASGVLVLAFIAYHAAQMWAIGTGPHTSVRDVYAVLWQTAGRPWNVVIYLLGISATCFHFGHGLARAAVTWGLAPTPRAVLWWRVAAGVLGAALWGMLLHLFAHFALGAALIPR